jgi:hypothetical protein
MSDLGEIVVLVNVHAKLDLLHLAGSVLSFLLLLGEVVAEFSEIHNPADRWLGAWGNLNEIETDGARVPESLLDAHHSHLLVGNAVDYTHLARAYAFVDTNVS